MSPKRWPTRTATARQESQCGECVATIRIGDQVKQKRLETGALVWVHMDCRGRFAREMGLSPDQIEAAKPAPRTWNPRPPCPSCGALMAKDGAGGYVCGLHVPPIYKDGED